MFPGSPHRGLLFISGGFKGPYRGHLNTVWALDPEVNTWSQKASMLHARSYHSMVSTASHILVAGGVNYVGEDTFEDVRVFYCVIPYSALSLRVGWIQIFFTFRNMCN